jgi:hypothetical protein
MGTVVSPGGANPFGILLTLAGVGLLVVVGIIVFRRMKASAAD